jgi:hypothetical protein
MVVIGSGAAFAADADFASRDFRFFGISSGFFALGDVWLFAKLGRVGEVFPRFGPYLGLYVSVSGRLAAMLFDN